MNTLKCCLKYHVSYEIIFNTTLNQHSFNATKVKQAFSGGGKLTCVMNLNCSVYHYRMVIFDYFATGFQENQSFLLEVNSWQRVFLVLGGSVVQ